MKGLLFISLFSIVSAAQAAADWKVVAETSGCAEKVKILAKEGEKYVRAVHNENERNLYSQDGSAYSSQALKSVQFSSDTKKEKYLLGDATYTFTQPGMAEGNPPKVDVAFSGRQEHCRMNSK